MPHTKHYWVQLSFINDTLRCIMHTSFHCLFPTDEWLLRSDLIQIRRHIRWWESIFHTILSAIEGETQYKMSGIGVIVTVMYTHVPLGQSISLMKCGIWPPLLVVGTTGEENHAGPSPPHLGGPLRDRRWLLRPGHSRMPIQPTSR